MRSRFKKFIISFFIVLSLISFIACSDETKSSPNVAELKPDLKLIRFEQLLFNLDSTKLHSEIDKLKLAHPEFSALFFNQILSDGQKMAADSDVHHLIVKEFISDSAIRQVYQKTQHLFRSNQQLEQMIYNSLQYFKHYFPQLNEPVFYTLISGFAYGNFIFLDQEGKDGLGIGLEFFLGKEIDYKMLDPENPAFSDYLSRSFNLDHLLSKTWSSWIDDHLGEPIKPDLLNYMILRGIKVYFLEHLLPQVQDTVLFEYSKAQLEWCRKNTLEMWSYFMAQDLLYSNELMKINKFINSSPNSPGMPSEAPGRTGAYIGYEIVKSYMKHNPQTSLSDLLFTKDEQEIFKKSKFKPRND